MPLESIADELNRALLAAGRCFGRYWSCGRAVKTCLPAPRLFRDKRANITVFTLQQRTAPAAVNAFTRGYAADAKASPTEVSSILEQRIRGVQEESGLAETGRVLTVGYGRLESIIIGKKRMANTWKVTVSLVSTV